MNNGIKIGIIAAAVAIGLGLASPLFYETEVDEPLPVALNDIQEGLTFEKFSMMDDESRQDIVEKMPSQVKDMIMEKAATITRTINEDMSTMESSSIEILKSGNFEGLGGHQAEGTAKYIQVGGDTFLRFEQFQVTNGPDLRVYLTHDGDVKSGIHLEKLKGSKGDQNYLLSDIDTEFYNTVVIYCQPFGVYFGQAQLS